ncbi:MAG: transposase [Rhodobacteraceae bacterium]|nr:transposase [Paracoccaceae bacterium]MCF8521004.1 transposase [Paracoccaceae bacterium]
MDETYIKVKGKWTYRYPTVNGNGKSLISCSLCIVASQVRSASSGRQMAPMVSPIASLSTKVLPIWRVWKLRTQS